MSHAWPMVALGEVLSERRETPPAEAITSGQIRVIAKIGFSDGKIQLRLDGGTKTGMILVRPGDLVVSGINAAKGAIALYEESATAPLAATIHYGSYAINRERADARFLWWLLRSAVFRDLLKQHVPGGIKTELKARRLLPIPILLPTLAEQRRIVGRIHALAATLDQVHRLRENASTETDTLLKARLKALSQGFANMGALSDVLLEPPRNGWSARCDNVDGGTAVLTLRAVTGFRYNPAAYKRTSLPTDPNAHYWLKPGDLLLTRSNTPELVGHAAIYDGNPAPCVYPDLVMRVVVDEQRANKRFVWYWMRSPSVRDYLRLHAKGTSPTMKKITQGIVMGVPFPKDLSVNTQQQMVRDLDTLEESADAARELQTGTAADLDALLPSFLDHAFKGDL